MLVLIDWKRGARFLVTNYIEEKENQRKHWNISSDTLLESIVVDRLAGWEYFNIFFLHSERQNNHRCQGHTRKQPIEKQQEQWSCDGRQEERQ